MTPTEEKVLYILITFIALTCCHIAVQVIVHLAVMGYIALKQVEGRTDGKSGYEPPGKTGRTPCSPTQIIDRMLDELNPSSSTCLKANDEVLTMGHLPSQKSITTHGSSGRYSKMQSISAMKSRVEPASNLDACSLQNLTIKTSHEQPSQSPMSSTPPRSTASSSFSTGRRSLGMEFGLRDCVSDEGVSPADETVSDVVESIGCQDTTSLDVEMASKCAIPEAAELSAERKLASATIDAAKDEGHRRIVIIEMEEDQQPRPFDQIRAMFERKIHDVSNLVPHHDLNLLHDRPDDQGSAASEVLPQPYTPQGYLEPVVEVTEEPTMILYSLQSDEESSAMTLRSPIRLRQHYPLDRAVDDSPASSTVSSIQGQTTPLHRVWAQMHGLGTPSTLSSSHSRYGWADVIASTTRSPYSTPIATWFSPKRTASSPMPSPAQMLGMRSSFWLASPPRFLLDPVRPQNSQSISNRDATQSQRQSIDTSSLLDGSEWIDAALDSYSDFEKAGRPSLSKAFEVSKRGKHWKKRLSSHFHSSAA